MMFTVVFTGCGDDKYKDAHMVVLDSVENADGTYTHKATVDGVEVEEFDHTWHADPSEVHDEVKDSPAEYYTGTSPDTDAAVYIAHDIYYYPELDAERFSKVSYDGETEWVYYYTAEEYKDYIFSTLPLSGESVPEQMMHSEEEAYQNAVLHITQAGTYIIEGQWHGQIWVDLGDKDDTYADENAKVDIILNGVNVTCTVAPAFVAYSAYECDNEWESQESWTADADTSEAGINIIIADDTVNDFEGTNIFRILKTKYKDEEEVTDGAKAQKKQWKIDGAFYSYVSMNIDGESKGSGILNITSGFEGLGSEHHFTVNGGNLNIYSQDDGINVNEDGVSVLTINDGSVHILGGLGREGDGIDSNGYLVVNNGTLVTMANPGADSGMDSDCGTYVNGGTVLALGSTMDWAESSGDSETGQAAMNLSFAGSQNAVEAIIVTDTDGKVIFAYDPDKDEVTGSNARTYSGAIISAPGINVGGEYNVYICGDVYGTEVSGVYDTDTVTGFSEEAVQQCYMTAGELGYPGGAGGFGGQRPEGMEPPEGFRGQRPEGIELPEGFEGQRPEGMEFPEGFESQRPNGMNRLDEVQGEGITVFIMETKVNGFINVMDLNK